MDETEGRLLATARRRAGLSQRRLAGLAGTSQATVARIESGRQAPSLVTLRRLVRACGLNLHVQVEGDEERDKPAAGPAQTPPSLRSHPAQTGGRHLLLQVGDGPVAVPIERVREVLPARDVRPLPGQPDGMAGVIAVRGTPVACVDLARRLGIEPAGRGAIAVLETGHGPVGAIVGGAQQVIDLRSDAISTIPPSWSRNPLLRGLARTQHGLVPVLDPGPLSLAEPRRSS